MQIAALLSLQDPYNRRVLPGATDYARQQSWDLAVHDIKHPDQLAPAVAGADALLIGVHYFEEEPILSRTQLPAVTWSGSRVELNWRRVMNDDLMVGRLAAEHLLARGLVNFAYFTESPEAWSSRRSDGYLGRLEAEGLSATIINASLPADHAKAIATLLALPRPLGVMIAHDETAVHVMHACREAGLTIPDDVAFVGVNNDEMMCQSTDPPLTSIPILTHRIGAEAAALLGQLIEGVPNPPWAIVVPPGDIVVRHSSDTLATDDRLVIDAVKMIAKGLPHGISTKEVAAAFGYSRTTLDKRFLAAIGRTVAAEIRRERIDRSRQLLGSTDLPMPEVARRVGFSSARQLSETFRHFVGQTPTAYRRQHSG